MDINLDKLPTTKTYGIIYSDPPWSQKKGNLRACRPNQTRDLDYVTMSLEDIKEIHRKVLPICYDKHNIFIWTVDKFLFDTEKMMNDLGYQLHARFIWDKGNGIAPAFTVRYTHEYLLWFYKKGHLLMPIQDQRGKYTTIIRENSTVHSHKPESAYKMLESMFPGVNKLELFARNHRLGWDCWGNETSKFDGV